MARASDAADAVVAASYYVGRSVVLFTMFYCSLNWWTYRRARLDAEAKSNKDKDDKKKP